MNTYDIIIIGGGPAGLAAALGAREEGAERILILERDSRLGGILNQCIHNGFGLHTFKEELTGPEYAQRYIDKVKETDIEIRLDTMVIDLGPDKKVTYINRTDGLVQVRARAIVLAMGCRERSRGALNIPGYRPAGIFSAGTAQRLVNIEGECVGKEVVILGSGDIGLIMARRMTLEGAKVKAVAEVMPYSGGLKRNIVQCLDDYGIPLLLKHTVVEIRGKKRVEGVVIAEVDDARKPIPGTEKYYSCDTLLLSVGLLPENELTRKLNVEMDRVTGGPKVNEHMQTESDGVFACGNVLHVHDLVDYVSEEATAAGKSAARYVKSCKAADAPDAAMPQSGSGDGAASAMTAPSADAEAAADAAQDRTADLTRTVPIRTTGGVRYTVPQKLDDIHSDDRVLIRFRVDNIYKNKALCVYLDGDCVIRKRKAVFAPGEMEQTLLTEKMLREHPSLKEIKICLE